MLRNAGFLLVTETIVRLAALALTIAIARRLGAGGYGQYSYALAFAATYAAFADFGTSRYLTRAIAHERQFVSHLLTAAWLAKGAVLAPSLAAAVVLAELQRPDDRPVLLLFLAAATAQSLAGLLRAVFFGFERMDLDTVSRLGERLIAIVGALLALLLGFGLAGVGAALLFAGLVDLCVVTMIAGRHFARPSPVVAGRQIVSMLQGALPLGVFGLVLSLYAGLPLFLLTAWRGAAGAGLYGAAATPVLSLIPLPVQIAAASLPVFTRLAANDRAALRATFGLLLRLSLLAGLAAALGLMIVADAAVALIYGPAFAPAGPALRTIAIGLLGIFPTQVCVNLLVATGNQRTLLVIDIAALIWQFAIDVIAIPRFGVGGAALGTASAEIVVAVLFFGAAVRVTGMPALGPVLRAIPAVAGMAAVAELLLRRYGLAPAIIGGALSYAALLLVSRPLSRDDIAGVRRLFGR